MGIATGVAVPAPDPAWPEGTWTNTKGYRSGAVRATILYIALAIEALAYAGLIVISVAGFGLVDRALSGSLTETEVTRYVATEKGIAGLALLAGILAVVMLLAWLSRSVDNAPNLLGGTPRWSPRWAIGWWFVPIAWWFVPYRIVADLDRRMAHGISAPARWLLEIWWALWVFGGVVSGIVNYLPVNTAEQVKTALTVQAFGYIPIIGSNVLTLLVVLRIQRHAQTRALSIDQPPIPAPAT